MNNRLRQHSYFELIIIAVLTVLACWQAWHLSLAGALTVFHAAFLIFGYLSLRLLVARLNVWAGKLIFATALLLLAGDLMANMLSGMHLNTYILSLTLQPGFTEAIGLSPAVIFLIIAGTTAAALLVAKKFAEPAFNLQARIVTGSALAALILSQATFAWHFFHGNAEIEEIRRDLPFFTSVHPYRIRKAFGFFLKGPLPANPFSTYEYDFGTAPKTQKTDATELRHSRNVLLIVADSLRAKDLGENEALMPNLRKLATRGKLNLEHYSTSNCTHFSFYSMFTGKLPTGFGQARRSGQSTGLLNTFAAAGYRVSTAESSTLDWYQTSNIILPANTNRYIADAESQSKRDVQVSQHTLSILASAQKSSQPFFHMAYYYGPHYPYDPVTTGELETSKERYLATLAALDQELGRLSTFMEANDLLEDTILVFTSDHGEELVQEKGLVGHGSNLSSEQTLVPFLLVNKTGASLPYKARSHLDIRSLLLGNPSPAEPGPVVLAQCGYDQPRGFSVIENDVKSVFDATGGYLSPVYSAAPTGAEKEKMSVAALKLIQTLRRN